MPLLRMSLARCMDGCIPQVEELFDQLQSHYSTFPGYVMGFRFGPEEHAKETSNEVGRLAVWEDHEKMNRAATHEHSIALRSQINLLLVSGEHEELVYRIQGTPHNLPSSH